MLDLTVIAWARGMCVKFSSFTISTSFLLYIFLTKSPSGHFFLNVPNTVIWEGEGEVSVSMPEQVP